MSLSKSCITAEAGGHQSTKQVAVATISPSLFHTQPDNRPFTQLISTYNLEVGLQPSPAFLPLGSGGGEPSAVGGPSVDAGDDVPQVRSGATDDMPQVTSRATGTANVNVPRSACQEIIMTRASLVFMR